MLTGDENIVDVDFVVFWRIKDAQAYLFNIQNPEVTVKEVAESAMREIVGQSNIQPILTEARQKTEQAVQKLMQEMLDHYKAGIRIDQVQLQKVDPPTQVIDAFRDVQAARADQERLQNEAFAYANRVVPEARGEAERILQGARAATRSRPWPRRTGRRRASSRSMRSTRRRPKSRASACISRPWSACSAAPTRSSSTARRARAWCPILPLDQLQKRKEGAN